MSQKTLILEGLKALIRAQGVTYAQLAKKLKISESSIKKYFSESRMTLDVLDQICIALNTNVDEILSQSRELNEPLKRRFRLDQEDFLAESDLHFYIFFHILRGISSQEILSKLNETSKLDFHRCIRSLEQLELIRTQPKGGIIALFSFGASIQAHGPLWKKFHGTAISEFFKADFSIPKAHLNLCVGYLSQQNAKALQAKLFQIEQEFSILSSKNQRSQDSQDFYWLVTASRTMNTSILDIIAADPRFRKNLKL